MIVCVYAAASSSKTLPDVDCAHSSTAVARFPSALAASGALVHPLGSFALVLCVRAIQRARMKYMITWNERSQGSPMEYENAQKRILEVFRQWKAPANFKIEMFVIRVGDWGGYMLLDCDDPLEVHKFSTMLPAFVFEARPVIPIEDAVRGELEVMAWRDGLKR